MVNYGRVLRVHCWNSGIGSENETEKSELLPFDVDYRIIMSKSRNLKGWVMKIRYYCDGKEHQTFYTTKRAKKMINSRGCHMNGNVSRFSPTKTFIWTPQTNKTQTNEWIKKKTQLIFHLFSRLTLDRRFVDFYYGKSVSLLSFGLVDKWIFRF